jgi:hypothetical protein
MGHLVARRSSWAQPGLHQQQHQPRPFASFPIVRIHERDRGRPPDSLRRNRITNMVRCATETDAATRATIVVQSTKTLNASATRCRLAMRTPFVVVELISHVSR